MVFDEFNRLPLATMSDPAFKSEEYMNLGRLGLFMTMNPGYAGRTEIVESMKQSHNQLAFKLPDRELLI